MQRELSFIRRKITNKYKIPTWLFDLVHYPSNNMLQFGSNVAAAIKRSKYSINDVAIRMGSSSRDIKRVIKGNAWFNFKQFNLLCGIFDIQATED